MAGHSAAVGSCIGLPEDPRVLCMLMLIGSLASKFLSLPVAHKKYRPASRDTSMGAESLVTLALVNAMVVLPSISSADVMVTSWLVSTEGGDRLPAHLHVMQNQPSSGNDAYF